MEPWDLVVNALVAGAAAGAGDTASTAVRDAYNGLRSLAAKALRRSIADVEDDAEIETTLSDPAKSRAELIEALSDADIEEDDELLASALRVLELTKPQESATGKYSVAVALRDNKGVQVGDNNTQTNTFGS